MHDFFYQVIPCQKLSMLSLSLVHGVRKMWNQIKKIEAKKKYGIQVVASLVISTVFPFSSDCRDSPVLAFVTLLLI